MRPWHTCCTPPWRVSDGCRGIGWSHPGCDCGHASAGGPHRARDPYWTQACTRRSGCNRSRRADSRHERSEFRSRQLSRSESASNRLQPPGQTTSRQLGPASEGPVPVGGRVPDRATRRVHRDRRPWLGPPLAASPEIVLFDLGGVLVESAPCHPRVRRTAGAVRPGAVTRRQPDHCGRRARRRTPGRGLRGSGRGTLGPAVGRPRRRRYPGETPADGMHATPAGATQRGVSRPAPVGPRHRRTRRRTYPTGTAPTVSRSPGHPRR